MVLRLVNDDQKKRCMEAYQDIIEWLQTEPDLLHRVITGEETWIFDYDQENQPPEQSVETFDVTKAEEARQSY